MQNICFCFVYNYSKLSELHGTRKHTNVRLTGIWRCRFRSVDWTLSPSRRPRTPSVSVSTLILTLNFLNCRLQLVTMCSRSKHLCITNLDWTFAINTELPTTPNAHTHYTLLFNNWPLVRIDIRHTRHTFYFNIIRKVRSVQCVHVSMFYL